jgi:hypothetical protein
MKKVLYTVLDVDEFEKLVKQEFGVKSFEPAADYEWNNGCYYGTDYTLEEANKEADDSYYSKKLNAWIEGDWKCCPSWQFLIATLIALGTLEPGAYLIHSSW